MPRSDKPLEYTPTGELYIGSQIRKLRQEKGWGLREFAQRMQREPAWLSNIETNNVKPPKKMLTEIATALGVTLEDLSKAPLHPRITEGALYQPPPQAVVAETTHGVEATSPTRRRSKKPREASESIAGVVQVKRNEQLREILRQSAALFAQLAELAKAAEVLLGGVVEEPLPEQTRPPSSDNVARSSSGGPR